MNGYDTYSVSQSQPVFDQTNPPKKRISSRIKIQNLPQNYNQDTITQLFTGFGTVKKSNFINSDNGAFVTVLYELPEDAQKAIDQLNNSDYEGSKLKVELMPFNNTTNGRMGRYGRIKMSPMSGGGRGPGQPVRILVPSDYVGAIIGRKGQTIRTITTKCKARVDVHGKDNTGLLEKIISIYGQPENCTNAVKEILQVMKQESDVNSRGEIILKMLANDRFCGRIIGKEGKIIKKIRNDTSTKITISNAIEMAVLYPDRAITILGSVEGMAQAEAAISAKLAECMEQEMQQGGGMMMMSMGPGGGFYPNNRAYPDINAGYYAPMYPPMSQAPMGSPVGTHNEICQIAVPNTAVGAIIGTAGANIKQIMRDSGAFVNIEPKKESDPAGERLVTIKGTLDACWRASYMIFEKMKYEGYAGVDDVRLKTIVKISKATVGRIIGKGGKNVRELQRMTGAMIKLPEDPSVQGDDVSVEVYGTFMSTQAAHSRIRSMADQQNNFINGGPPSRGPRKAGGANSAPAPQPVEA